MNRLRRSDFVDDGREQVGLFRIRQRLRKIPQRARRAQHRGQRRLEVVRDRRQQRRAQAVRFHGALDPVHVLDQLHPFDRQRALIHQRVEQAALVRRQQRSGPVVVDADHADRAAAGPHRQEQAFCAGQRIRAAARGAIVAPRPVRGRKVGLVELVLRGIAGLHGDDAVLGQQQHHAHPEHQRGLIGGRPQHVVQRRGARELAAEGVERLRGPHPADREVGLRAHPRGDIGDQYRDQHEEKERRDIGRIGDREIMHRRQEEKIVAQRGRDAGQQRRPQPEADGDAYHRGKKHQVDVFDPEYRLDQLRRRRAPPRR